MNGPASGSNADGAQNITNTKETNVSTVADIMRTKLDMARRGFPQFPLMDNLKRPAALNGWQQIATTDVEQVRDWAVEEKNLGIATGREADLYVFDIDMKLLDGKTGFDTLAELEAEHGPLPETLTVRTPSGGEHRYFRFPTGEGAWTVNVGKPGHGLDFRADGGLVVAPGAVIDGKEYVITKDVAIAACPQWLADATKNAPKKVMPLPADVEFEGDAARYDHYVLATLKTYILGPLDACRGAQAPHMDSYRGPAWNKTTYDACGDIITLANSPWNRLTLARARQLILEHAPRDAHFTTEIIVDMFERQIVAQGGRGRDVPVLNADLLEEWVAMDAAKVEALNASQTPWEGPVDTDVPTEPETAPEVPSWAPMDLSSFIDGTFVAQPSTIMSRADKVCLLYPGKTHSFHGESESGKSWLGLVAAVELVNDDKLVVFIDFESDPATVVGRMLRLGAGRLALAKNFHYIKPDRAATSAYEADAWKALLATRPTLIVMDGVTEALSVTATGESENNDKITAWQRAYPKMLAERTGAAVVMIDHVTKNSDTRGRFALGGQAKLSALTGAAYVVEIKGDSPLGDGLRGEISMRIAKDRPGQVRPHSGKFRASDRTQETAVVVIDSTEPGVTSWEILGPTAEEDEQEIFEAMKAKIWRLVQAHPEGMTKTAIKDHDDIRGRATTIQRLTTELVDGGFLVSNPDAKSKLIVGKTLVDKVIIPV